MTLLDPTNVAADFRRDQWGRPLIVPAAGGKPVPYTRASSAAKTIDDHYNLEMWARRNIVFGMARDASLVARMLAIGGDPGSWNQPTKNRVNAIHEDAQKVAQSHKAADIGTALHTLTEQLDRGQPVHGGMYQADLDAYRDTMFAAGYICHPEWVECRMVCDDLEVAGTADRIVTNLAHRHFIADLKTGPTVDYGGLGWAAQLACYANGTIYNVDLDERVATPDIDTTFGIIIHLPAGQGRCTLYEIDLVEGLGAAELANEIRATRKASKQWINPVTPREPDKPGELPTPRESGPAPALLEDRRRAELRDRYRLLGDSDRERFVNLAIDPDDLDAIERALNELDPFVGGKVTRQQGFIHVDTFTPPPLPSPVDEGEDLTDEHFILLESKYATLNDLDKAWLAGVVNEARRDGVAFHANKSTGRRTVRRYDLYSGLLVLAQSDNANDQMVREIVATILDSDAPLHPALTCGHVLGSLDAEQAATFARICVDIASDPAAVELRVQPVT